MILCLFPALFLSLASSPLVYNRKIELPDCDNFTDVVIIDLIFANKDHNLFVKTLERDVIDDFNQAAELVSNSEKSLEKKTAQLMGNVTEEEKEQRRKDAESVLNMTAEAAAYAGCHNLDERQFPGKMYSLLFEEEFQIVNDASKKEMIAEALNKAKEELKIEILDRE